MSKIYYLWNKNTGTKVYNKPFKTIGRHFDGWYFSLFVYPEDQINNLDDWRKLIHNKDFYITDDNLNKVSSKKMIGVITERSTKKLPSFVDKNFLDEQAAEIGLNNLLRDKVGFESKLIGHGEGTYSYVIPNQEDAEFSSDTFVVRMIG